MIGCGSRDHHVMLENLGFDTGSRSNVNNEINTKFRELFLKISVGTTIAEFVVFNDETEK